jgi:hypothetical protein
LFSLLDLCSLLNLNLSQKSSTLFQYICCHWWYALFPSIYFSYVSSAHCSVSYVDFLLVCFLVS